MRTGLPGALDGVEDEVFFAGHPGLDLDPATGTLLDVVLGTGC